MALVVNALWVCLVAVVGLMALVGLVGWHRRVG